MKEMLAKLRPNGWNTTLVIVELLIIYLGIRFFLYFIYQIPISLGYGGFDIITMIETPPPFFIGLLGFSMLLYTLNSFLVPRFVIKKRNNIILRNISFSILLISLVIFPIISFFVGKRIYHNYMGQRCICLGTVLKASIPMPSDGPFDLNNDMFDKCLGTDFNCQVLYLK
jgi:hypothetical protein